MSDAHDAHGAHGEDGHGHGGGAGDFPGAAGVCAAALIAGLALAAQVELGPMKKAGGASGHEAPSVARWPAPLPGAPDLILRNGRIVVPGFEPASVLLIREGKILAVGGNELLAAGEASTRVRDLAGAVVIPGLRDAHGHLAELGGVLNERRCDLANATGLADLVRRLRTWIETKRHPKPGEWLVGRGWDESKWSAGASGPSRQPDSTELLDAACPENPVILYRVDGHAAWVNRKALELAKISKEGFVVPGGEIVRGKSGEPTGILIDRALDLVARLLPPDPPEWIEQDVLRGAEACAKAGLVEVHAAGVDAAEEAALRKLAAAGRLPIRVYAMVGGEGDGFRERLSGAPVREAIGGRLVIRAAKLYADGAMGSHGARLLRPYADKPQSMGVVCTSREDMEPYARLCAERGYQLCVHAIGDAANRDALDVFERALPAGEELEKGKARPDARFRLEHAQLLDPADIPRLARLGVVASMQPTHATTDMRWAEDRLGKERLVGAYAWRALLRTGAHVAFGSDFPVESERPLLGLYAAVTRQDAKGQPEGGWRPEERLTPEEALRAFTVEPAYAAFAEKERGTIAPGMAADLTILSADPLELLRTDPRKVLDVQVVGTYVGGVATP